MTGFIGTSIRRWVRNQPKLRSLLRLPGRLSSPVSRMGWKGGVHAYRAFLSDWRHFRQNGGRAGLLDIFPILHEKTEMHDFDPHYFHQAVWAARKVAEARPALHHDIGSQAIFVGMLTAITEVRFIDLRPLGVSIDHLTDEAGSLLALPMPDRSVTSLSCLHVLEHVGLGRYGDPVDPDGARKGAAELGRVLAPGGQLYLSVPVGRPRTEFNAHRVFDAQTVVDLFAGLRLREFSLIGDDGTLRPHAPLAEAVRENFGCGLFEIIRD